MIVTAQLDGRYVLVKILVKFICAAVLRRWISRCAYIDERDKIGLPSG